MTRWRMTGALVVAVLVLGACARVQGVAETKRALRDAGYSDIDISLDAKGGLGFVTVELSTIGAPRVERAAELVWDTLPVRFYALTVAVEEGTGLFLLSDAMEQQFGPRDPALDRREIDEEVVENGVRLMLMLSAGALLSVGAVVAIALVGFRAGRRARQGAGQAEGPTSGLGAASLIADDPAESEGDEAIPS